MKIKKLEIWTPRDQEVLEKSKAFLQKRGVAIPTYKHEIISLAYNIEHEERLGSDVAGFMQAIRQ